VNKISPSILSADFADLMNDIKEVEKAEAEYLHIDIMDGHFVPNISMGPPVIESLSKKTDLDFDVHLMIDNPDEYIEKFAFKNTKIITVHAEATNHLHRTIQKIKSLGIKAGVSLNPGTSVSSIDYLLEEIDMVLVMSVNPGFGGQSFIESAYRKIKELRTIAEERNLNFDIEVDGGVNINNVEKVIEAGANIIVAGSAIFNAEDIYKATIDFKEKMNK